MMVDNYYARMWRSSLRMRVILADRIDALEKENAVLREMKRPVMSEAYWASIFASEPDEAHS